VPTNASSTQSLPKKLQTAAQHLRHGRRTEAFRIYEELAEQAPRDGASQAQLGFFCLSFGAFDRAVEHYTAAIEQDPRNAQYLGSLASAHQQNGDKRSAFDLYERALALDGETAAVCNGLGVLYMDRGDYAGAKRHLLRSVQLKSSDANAQTNLAIALQHLSEHEQALQHAQKAVKLDPVNPDAHFALASILTEMGRMDAAVRHAEKTIQQHRTFGEAYDLLARMRKFTEADKPFIAAAEEVLDSSMPAKQRYSLHYALGKMYDDCGEWNEAFAHFEKANLLKKRPFDLEQVKKVTKLTRSVFDRAALERYRAFGHDSAHPVFIVGMPRSGTTLMEQMIASHPRAAGADELMELPRIARIVSPDDDLQRFATRTYENLTRTNIAAQAEAYLRVLRQGRETADRVVDKQPANFFHLGLISILFPNATIIHAVRNPLDTCLSCYFQNFSALDWANDLKQIAGVYRLYREAMAHWERVLPGGKILEIRYERLTEDPSTEGRRMLEGCGLEWDEGRLRFYEQNRVVKTASVWQARQAIYRRSEQRWVHYASHLGELAAALWDYLPIEDRQTLEERGLEPRGSLGWLKRLIR
jgi:tetratricopeptide (TPR) repeat protein